MKKSYIALIIIIGFAQSLVAGPELAEQEIILNRPGRLVYTGPTGGVRVTGEPGRVFKYQPPPRPIEEMPKPARVQPPPLPVQQKFFRPPLQQPIPSEEKSAATTTQSQRFKVPSNYPPLPPLPTAGKIPPPPLPTRPAEVKKPVEQPPLPPLPRPTPPEIPARSPALQAEMVSKLGKPELERRQAEITHRQLLEGTHPTQIKKVDTASVTAPSVQTQRPTSVVTRPRGKS